MIVATMSILTHDMRMTVLFALSGKYYDQPVAGEPLMMCAARYGARLIARLCSLLRGIPGRKAAPRQTFQPKT